MFKICKNSTFKCTIFNEWLVTIFCCFKRVCDFELFAVEMSFECVVEQLGHYLELQAPRAHFIRDVRSPQCDQNGCFRATLHLDTPVDTWHCNETIAPYNNDYDTMNSKWTKQLDSCVIGVTFNLLVDKGWVVNKLGPRIVI